MSTLLRSRSNDKCIAYLIHCNYSDIYKEIIEMSIKTFMLIILVEDSQNFLTIEDFKMIRRMAISPAEDIGGYLREIFKYEYEEISGKCQRDPKPITKNRYIYYSKSSISPVVLFSKQSQCIDVICVNYNRYRNGYVVTTVGIMSVVIFEMDILYWSTKS